MTELCVIFNPAASSHRARVRLRRLQSMAQEAEFLPTYAAGHAVELARNAALAGRRTVVAAGGDGTINEVLNGLMSAPAETRPRLGVLPLGTANVYARELGLPLDLNAAWRAIVAGVERRVDVGVARAADGSPHYFAQLAGAGFDALAVADVESHLKQRISGLAYVVSGFRVVARGLPQVIVRADDRRVEGGFVFIGNGRFYGGPFPLFPDARLDDGLLDVCVFRGSTIRDALRYIPLVLCRRHTGCPDVCYCQARQVRIEAASPVPTEVDGELWKNSPVEFSVEAGTLRVLVPAG
ncbi:MAG: diacylglycerol kinase family lipid kinase [Verrucomicrobiae bacterium]|nr:diacylglycerol kinase family lipid kinase [Verrucomicrobiae bacterium]